MLPASVFHLHNVKPCKMCSITLSLLMITNCVHKSLKNLKENTGNILAKALGSVSISKIPRGAGVAQSVNIPPLISALVMISRLIRICPTSGSALTAQSLLGILSLPLFLSFPHSDSLSFSLLLSQNK